MTLNFQCIPPPWIWRSVREGSKHSCTNWRDEKICPLRTEMETLPGVQRAYRSRKLEFHRCNLRPGCDQALREHEQGAGDFGSPALFSFRQGFNQVSPARPDITPAPCLQRAFTGHSRQVGCRARHTRAAKSRTAQFTSRGSPVWTNH